MVADDEDRLVDDVGRQVAAGLAEIRDVARELPRALEDGLLLEADDLRLQVQVGLERAAGRLALGRHPGRGGIALDGVLGVASRHVFSKT